MPEENAEEQIFPMSGSDLAQDYVMEKKMKEIAQPYGDPVDAGEYSLYQNKNYGQPINVDMTQLFLGAYVSMEIDQNIGHTIAGKYYYIPGTNIYEDAVQIPSFTTKAKASQFTDVNANTPHHEDIAWLAEHKISEGYKKPDGSYQFEGMTSVYRQDMAAFLHRLDALLTK